MPTIDDAFPSKYMKVSDLPEEGSVVLTIEKVTIEEIGKEKERKPVIHFFDHDKSFVCNKTNANTIASLTGSRDFDDWANKQISLGRSEVEAFGEMVEAIRVRLKPVRSQKPGADIKRGSELEEDEIPF